MDKVQVFILTHNRPSKIQFAIDSVLKQTYKNIELIISDNSTNEDTEKLLSKNYFNKFKYIRRNDLLPPIDHLNIILSEVRENYFMMFHDDDEMHENMIETLYKNINEQKDVVAIGSNAFFKRGSIITKEKSLKINSPSLLLTNYFQVANQYILRNGIVPFPSYLYRGVVSKKCIFDIQEGGQNSDMTFIMKLTNLGKVKFLESPLMTYSVDSSNNRVPNMHNNMKEVLNFLINSHGSKNYPETIKKIRTLIVYLEIKQGILTGKIKLISKKFLFSFCNLLYYSTFNYFPRLFALIFLRIFNISTKKIIID
jgi:glycosyltransferase involved in cell wall biosynthesis